MRSTGTIIAGLVVSLLVLSGCSRKEEQTQLPAAERTPSIGTAAVSSAAGLRWTIPAEWRADAERPMRVATYTTPAAEGDPEEGEVALFYFGPGEGGSIEANVQRWFSQFDQPDGRATAEAATSESMVVNGIRITIVRTSGTYNAAAGPMAPRRELKPNFQLIGAIAEGPQGAVFFKFTGPSATVQNQENHFLTLVRSIERS